jgi:hypothetical protein
MTRKRRKKRRKKKMKTMRSAVMDLHTDAQAIGDTPESQAI